MKPYGSTLANVSAIFRGRRPRRILLPSRGGIGTKLNTASMILIQMLATVICKIGTAKKAGSPVSVRMSSLARSVLSTARIRLDPGPANETQIISRLGFWKFRGSTGTGLAQPMLIRKNAKQPNRSRCFSGFKLKRPRLAAVLSPIRCAT